MAQPVKGLNKGKGRKRFVFKSFSQRIEEVDVDVFRSLTPIKADPSGGTSFFHESLIAWRELNSTREFTSVYEELMPIVQTMPQLVLHKELIMNSLLARLQISAILSLEPVLNLIAILSRDLREEFIPLIPKFLDACVELFQSGGDREPEVVEQVFTSLSHTFKYMQKLLSKDTAFVLKITKQLRYYQRSYIQEFATEAVAFLLRNTSPEQLVKGVRKIIAEVIHRPSDDNVTSCSYLLRHTLKGPGLTMHSRSEALLRLLLDRSTFESSRKKDPGGQVVVSVLSKAFCRLCDEFGVKKISLLWVCLLDELESSLEEFEKVAMLAGPKVTVGSNDHENRWNQEANTMDGKLVLTNINDTRSDVPQNEGDQHTSLEKLSQLHLANLLSIVNCVLEFRKGSQVSEFERLFNLSDRLLQLSCFASKGEHQFSNDLSNMEAGTSQVSFQVVRFILALVKGLSNAGSSTGLAAIALHACSWASLWNCQAFSSLAYFIQGLLKEDAAVVRPFVPYLFRTFDEYIVTHPGEVLVMVMDLFEKVGGRTTLTLLDQDFRPERLMLSVTSIIKEFTNVLSRRLSKDHLMTNHCPEPDLVWGALRCYPNLVLPKEFDSSLVWNCAIALDQAISATKVHDATEEDANAFLLAAAVSCELKLASSHREIKLSTHFNSLLDLAVRYRGSPQVLASVVDYFDLYLRDSNTNISLSEAPPELQDKFGIPLFESNLGSRSKLLRLSSLRLLAHFESLMAAVFEQVPKRRKGADGRPCDNHQSTSARVFEDLRSLEEAPLNLDVGRQSNLMLTRLKVRACAGSIPEQYLVPLTHAMIGILHNRFKLIWDGAIDSLAGLLELQRVAIWETFIHHLGSYQTTFLSEGGNLQTKKTSGALDSDTGSLQSRFNHVQHESCDSSTDAGTLVTLLLRAAQKIPKVAEAHTRQLIPLFLAFVEYSETVAKESTQSKAVCSGKDWKVVLKEWLNLLSLMKNAQAYFQGLAVKEVLINRFLMDGDPNVQLKALECVLNWKDNFLIPYEEHLRNLISAKTSREEMTTWNITKDDEVQISHRDGLVPILLRLLFPKILKTKSRLHNKMSGAVQRKVVLSFLAHLEVQELAYFFILVFKPLQSSFTSEGLRLIEGRHAWELAVERGIQQNFIEWLDVRKVACLPYKRKAGFLHMVKDVLETFDDNCIEPSLYGFMAFAFRIMEACQVIIENNHTNDTFGENKIKLATSLQECNDGENDGSRDVVTSDIDSKSIVGCNKVFCGHSGNGNTNLEAGTTFLVAEDGGDMHKTSPISPEGTVLTVSGAKDLRTLILRFLTVVFNKYDNLNFGPVYWDIFLCAVRPMIIKLGMEGVSGDSPGAVLSCLLSMSRSVVFVTVLKKETELVPNLASLLSHKNVSTSVISAALSFIENVLELQTEDKEIVSNIILPHLPHLLSNMQALLSSQQKLSRKMSTCAKRSLGILVQLSKYIESSPDAVQLLDVLLLFSSASRKANQEGHMEVLHILKLLAPNLDVASCERILSFLGPLLVSNSNQDIRLAVCHVLSALSAIDSSLGPVAKILSELNSMSKTTVGEYDYDLRSQTYSQLSTALFRSLSHNQAVLIVSQAIHDVGSDDISIRHSSSNCLSVFIHFLVSVYQNSLAIGLIDSKEKLSDLTPIRNKGAYENGTTCTSWNADSVKVFVHKVLLPNMRKAMGSDSLTARREWVTLLRDMSVNLHYIPPLNEFSLLISTDAEVDFFNNINHIQTHRRIRAMARFKELCSSNKLSQGTLVRLFVPLFMNSLFEGKGDNDGNLVQSAVEVIAYIAGHLHWDPYYSLLMQLFRKVVSHPQHERALIRLLCSVLDNFHFHISSVPKQSIQETDECGLAEDLVEGKFHSEAYKIVDLKIVSFSEERDVNATIPQDIQMQFQHRIFPEISKLMVSKRSIINIPVAVAVVKVLQLMPKEAMEVELPRILQSIINLLKDRSHAVRDEARAGLLAVVRILGAGYIGFVVDKLQQVLRRGFEVHVLGFTLNSLFTNISPTLKVGEIDYCADKISKLLANDIFESVAEEKEVGKIAFKMKETQKTRSYESVRLLAQSVTFQVHATTLLKPVRERLGRAVIPKVKSKIERLLRQLALGFQANPLVKQDELLVFVHGLVEDGILKEKSEVGANLNSKLSVVAKDAHSAEEFGRSSKVNSASVNHHLITEFALYLLESYLKRTKLHKSNHAVLSMLDPLVALLQNCLHSKQGGVLVATMKCFSYLLRLPLPSICIVSDDLITRVLVMAEQFGTRENQVAQSCFNVLVALLKHAKCAEVSAEQIRLILQLPIFVDLGLAENNTGLVLLKSIVGRKLVVPELYDMMNRVSHLMVTSQAASVRRSCSQIMLQFLLDYPLGSKRLQQHLDFFVTNLSYEHASGREAALEMLYAVTVKFPAQVIDEQSETLFLPLVTRLVNDDSNQVRAMIGTVLKVLMSRVSQRSVQKMLDFCFSWLEGGKHQLWRAAAQVLGFLIEVVKDKFFPNIQKAISSCVNLLQRVVEANAVDDRNASIGTALWQEGYYMLTMLEKLLNQFPDVCLQSNLEELWDIVCTLSMHEHAWIDKLCCRLLDMYFSHCGSILNSSGLKGEDQEVYLLQPSRLMYLAAVLCHQMDSEVLDDDGLIKQIQQNLLFVSTRLQSTLLNSNDRVSWIGLVGQSDPSAHARVLRALSLLQVGSWISQEEVDLDTVENRARKTKGTPKQVKEITLHQAKYHILLPVFKRVEKIALQANEVQARVVLGWYETISTQLGRGVQPYLASMLLPLHKIVDSVAAKKITDELKTCAENVLNHLRGVVGTSEFIQAYNEVRQLTKNIREERRRTQKLKVLVDPEGHAKRKQRLNAKRQLQKKKKRTQLKH